MPDWYTTDTIRADWYGAPASDDVLQQILDASKQQVLAFDHGYNWRQNPANADVDFTGDYTADEVPSNLLMAQRMQAKNLANASQVDPSNGQSGDDSFVLRPFPLDWVVKQVIRPKSPVAAFG